MATWPSGSKASTTNLDEGTDKPSLARADIKQNVDNVNSIIDSFNVSTHSNGDILVWDSANNRFNVETPTDNDTTYTLVAEQDGTAVNIVLTGSDASTDPVQFVAGSNITLSADSEGGITIASTDTGIANVVEDTTPQLGGNLDAQSNNITSVTTLSTTNVDATGSSGGHLRNSSGTDCLDWGSGGGANVSLLSNMTCGSNTISAVNFKDYKETIHSIGTTSGALSVDVANGNVQTVTLNGNATLDGFANAEAGQSVTLIVTQDGTGSRTLGFGDSAGRFLFAGAEDTLSTDASAVDIVSIIYDGTTYYASLSKDFS